MKKIPLTGKYAEGRFAFVDDEDFELVNQFKWWCFRTGNKEYAQSRKKGSQEKLYLHRLILRPKGKLEVDHIDGNGLDNRRKNIRLCTHQQNEFNQQLSKRNKSGYKGVYFSKDHRKWRAQITVNNCVKFLGFFITPEEASYAYNKAAKQQFGEFAYLNNLSRREIP